MTENIEKSIKGRSVELATIIGTGVAIISVMLVGFFQIQSQISDQARRTDKLYEMFIDLVKQVKSEM